MSHISPNEFRSLLVDESHEGRRVWIFNWEEEEIDRLTEDEFRANYNKEYRRACEEAEDEWFPYFHVGIIDHQQKYQYESYEIDRKLKKRWSNLRENVQQRYISEIRGEVFRAIKRREELKPKYSTEAGFLVKSGGEQALANALHEFTQLAEQNKGKKMTLKYEPLLRIPAEGRILVPDFVLLELCLVVEYAGLDDRNYKVGLILKIDAFRKLGIPVIVMRPEDLRDMKGTLFQKLRFYFGR